MGDFLANYGYPLYVLLFVLTGLYRMVLRPLNRDFRFKLIHISLLAVGSVAVALLAGQSIPLLGLGIGLLLLVEHYFSRREDWQVLAFALPLAFALLAFVQALRLVFMSFIAPPFLDLALGIAWAGLFGLRRLHTPHYLKDGYLVGKGFFQDEQIQLWILVLLGGLAGLLYFILRPLEADIWGRSFRPAWEIWLLLSLVSLGLTTYYFDECSQFSIAQRRLQRIDDLVNQLRKLFLAAHIFPDVRPEVWLDLPKSLDSRSQADLQELERVLPSFIDYVSQNLRRYYEPEKVQQVSFDLEAARDCLRLSVIGQGRPRTPEALEMSEEKSALVKLQALLSQGHSRYYEQDQAGRRQMILELRDSKQVIRPVD